MQIDKKRKRIALLILCAFILTVTSLMCWWILKGNRSVDKKIAIQNKQAFNTQLPEANVKDAGKNKLEIYMQAEKDSARLKEQQRKDYLEKRLFDPGPPDNEVFADEYPPNEKKKPFYRSKSSIDENEKKVNERLEKLYAALNNNDKTRSKNSSRFTRGEEINTRLYDNDVSQLEKLLQQIQQADTDSNTEMQQLEAMLDKVLDIQHPERVKERLTKNSAGSKEKFYTVTTNENGDPVYGTGSKNGFWGLDDAFSVIAADELSTISATVHQDQVLRDGSVIKLRLLKDIFINGSRIPKDNFIFGECTIGDQRLYIRFNSIAFNNSIYPVNLTAFDTDGNEGIYIPGAIGREAAKNGLNDAIQQMQLATLNPSVGAQAATAGIQAAQNLLSKKVKRVQVTVKAGHKLLLKMKQTG